MKNKLRLLPSLLLAAAALTAFAMTPPKKDWDRKADKKKAEALFYESQNAYMLEDYARYITLIQRAFELDSTDPGITTEWALVTLTTSNGDTLDATELRAYNYLKSNFFESPDNYNTGQLFCSVAEKYGRYNDLVRAAEVLDSVFPARNETATDLAQAYLTAYIGGCDSTAFDKAIAIYNRMEQGMGKTPTLSSYKIRAYLLKSDTSAIIDEVTALAGSAPNSSPTMLYAGVVLNYLDKPKSAIEYIDKACSIDSTYGPAFLTRAEYYRDLGDSLAFDREVFHALRSHNLEVETKLEILHSYVSELYSDSTQETRIRQLFNELQELNPGEAEIHSLYASYLAAIEDMPGAVEQYSYAVGLNPADNSSWFMLVQSAVFAEDTTAILTYTPQAMERNPGEFYFPFVLASTLNSAGRTGEAIEVLDNVDISLAKSPVVASNLVAFKGDIYANAGDTLTALKTYDRAIDLNSDNMMARNNAAYFLAENDMDLDKARQYSYLTIVDDPFNATYLDTYAWILFKLKQYPEAMEYINRAISEYIAAARKNEQAALNETDESPDPEQPVVAYGVDDIETTSVSTIYNSPRDPASITDDVPYDVLDHAGDIYFMNGERDYAVGYWKMALEKEPDSELTARKVQHKTIFFK